MGGFQEAKKQEVLIPEIDSDSFKTGSIADDELVGTLTGETSTDESLHKQYQSLTELYIATDPLENARVRDEIMTAMITILKTTLKLPDLVSIGVAYEKTPKKSPLRRAIVDAQFNANASAQADWFKHYRNTFPADFVFDYAHAHALIQWRNSANICHPPLQPKCHYHQYEGGPKCA